MTPERMGAFIRERPSDALRFALMHDQGLNSFMLVQSWTLDDIELSADPTKGQSSMVERIEAAGLEIANSLGETAHFSLQWHNKAGACVASRKHKITPNETRAELARDGTQAQHLGGDSLSVNRLIADMAHSLREQQKVLPMSIGIVLQANERVLAIQNGTIERQNVLIEQLTARLHALPPPAAAERELTPQEIEVQELKAEALKKAIGLGPDIVMIGLAALAQKFGIQLPWVANGAGNGKSPH